MISKVAEISKRTSRKVVICGQGDPEPYLKLSDNIEYKKPISGTERNELLGNAYCMVMPTQFIEPFGGLRKILYMTIQVLESKECYAGPR
jgi:hypothetical protein